MKESQEMQLRRLEQAGLRQAALMRVDTVLFQMWLYGIAVFDVNGKLVCPLDF